MKEKKIYEMLVRDKVPEALASQYTFVTMRTLGDEEFPAELDNSLGRAVEHYLQTGAMEELIDIYDILLEIIEFQNITFEEFSRKREKRAGELGGFSRKIFLASSEEI